MTGFEPAASWSQTTRATSCATPGDRQKKLAAFRFRLAAKTAHPLLPSSSPNRIRCAGLRFGKRRQKNSVPFRFRGLRKRRENCISTESFFLFRSNPLRRDLIGGNGREESCSVPPEKLIYYISSRGTAQGEFAPESIS